MRNYKQLVAEALKRGLMISVWDGEEWQVKCSGVKKDIVAAIESVEEAQIQLRNAAGEPVGWALIIPSLDADESVADFSDNELMNELAGC